MKICVVSNYKQNGYGESTRPEQMVKYLKLFGHSVLHICDWNGQKHGVTHISIPRDTWEKNPFKRLFDFALNWLRISFFKPDLIYAHQYNNAKWAVETRLFKGKKIVFDAHTSVYLEMFNFGVHINSLDSLFEKERNLCNTVDLIIAASAETKDFLVNNLKIASGKIEVVGNATTINPIESLTDNSTEKFICLATLPQDGFQSNQMALNMLLQVAEATFKVNNQIEFHIIGGGNMPSAKSPNVFFKGYVDDLRQSILNATICIMPFPDNAVCGGARNKFCDYIALGKTVVTTREGLRGMEVLVDKQNCIMANDIEQMVSAICDLYQNRAEITAIEREVFKVRNYFDWKDRASKVEAILRRLV